VNDSDIVRNCTEWPSNGQDARASSEDTIRFVFPIGLLDLGQTLEIVPDFFKDRLLRCIEVYGGA